MITTDGYELGVQRTPHGRKEEQAMTSVEEPVALLMHGLLGSSADLVINFPTQSLGKYTVANLRNGEENAHTFVEKLNLQHCENTKNYRRKKRYDTSKTVLMPIFYDVESSPTRQNLFHYFC